MDNFTENTLIPEYTRGKRRARNPAYLQMANELAKARRRGDRTQARVLRKTMRTLPSTDPHDPGYRRLHYCRYADDILLGLTGPKAEAEDITQRLAQFLHDDLKLELSQDKTLITHARTGAATFLSYEITVQHNDRQHTRGQRYVNANIALRVPRTVIKAQCAPYLLRGKPARRTPIINRDDYHIVATYGAEYRGIVQYYLLAGDVFRLNRLRWVMQTSLLRTLASKHRSTETTMAVKHRAKITTPLGPRTCYEATVKRTGRKPLVARFGGIPLARQKTAVIDDRTPARAAATSQGTTHPAPQGQVRTLRANRADARPPRRQTRRPRPARAKPTHVGRAHGTPPPKDTHHLRRLPPAHPHRATHHQPHGINH